MPSEIQQFWIKFVSYDFHHFFSSDNVLDSCNGSVISNNNMYVDFGVIKYQCSCSFNFHSNPTIFYSLSVNPGYNTCGTAIQITEIDDNKYKIPCTSSAPSIVPSSQFTTVELTCDKPGDASVCKNTGYCLRVFSNGRYCLHLDVVWNNNALNGFWKVRYALLVCLKLW